MSGRRQRFAFLAGALALIAIALSCGGDGGGENDETALTSVPSRPNVVSEAEARALLDSLVATVQAGKALEACQAGHSSRPICNDDGRLLSLAPVNQPPPTVLSSRIAFASNCTEDGRVLEITGLDADDQQYTSQFHVTRHDVTGRIYARFSAFWRSGFGGDEHCRSRPQRPTE